MNESRIIRKRRYGKPPETYVAHVTDCESCNGFGHGEALVYGSAGRTRISDCDDCNGTGEAQNPDCDCADCVANWKGLLLSESVELRFAPEIREWVERRERELAQQKADEAAGVVF